MQADKPCPIKQLGVKKLSQYKNIIDNPKWQKIDDDACHMYKMEIDGKMAAKGVCEVPFAMDDVVEYLKKQETLRQLDFQCVQSKIIEELDKQHLLGYIAFKGMWPVSGRDFSNILSIHREEARVYMVSASVTHQKVPQVKGYVRGDCICAGYLVQKLQEKKSKVTYLSFVDIKGSIPGMIKNKLAVNQSKIVSRITKNMTKNGK